MLTVFFFFFLAVTWGEYSLLLVSILYIILYYIEPFTGNWNFVFRQMTFIWSHCCAGCGGCGHHVNNHAPPPICDIYHTASVFVCVRESVCPTLCALARQLVLCSDGLQDCTHTYESLRVVEWTPPKRVQLVGLRRRALLHWCLNFNSNRTDSADICFPLLAHFLPLSYFSY